MEDAAHIFGWLDTPASGDPHFGIRLVDDGELWRVHALCIELWAHNAVSIKMLRLHASALIGDQALEQLGASPELCQLYVSGTHGWRLVYEISPSLYPNLSVLDISQALMEPDDIRALEDVVLQWQDVGLRLQQLILSKHTIDPIHGVILGDIVYV
jgi:hypothetical protein